MLNPLFTMVIYTIVFSRILRATPPPGNPSGLDVFGLYLLCGLLPWNFFSISVTTSMATLVGNGSLIKKVYFPREALVLGVIVSGLITFGIELALLCVVLMFFGNIVLPWLPVLVLLVALLAVFTTGVVSASCRASTSCSATSVTSGRSSPRRGSSSRRSSTRWRSCRPV